VRGLARAREEEEWPKKPGGETRIAAVASLVRQPRQPGMTALYLERYLNYGLTAEELQSASRSSASPRPGPDLSPCNRHHMELAKRVREGIAGAGGITFEFPVHPIQETGKRPTASLDRNLAYLGWSRSCTATRSTASCSSPAATRPRRPASWRPRPSTSRRSRSMSGPC
jgi:dihydroxy-acid dehydratase